ncbi:MAG: GxxExxY protein [Chloroflexota bacterium]|nr:GxxExxY protein [Chloroflexota bacterium]MDE2909220.1 GxxExxY protein [Chloroflexota bacterium]
MYRRDDLTHEIIGAAMEVHSAMGAGLIEQIYENALCVELTKRGIGHQKQVRVPVQYKGVAVGDLYADLVVKGRVIVELKSVRELAPIHEAQLITYLKLSKIKTGLLINFNVVSLKKGVRRFSV